MTCDQLASYFTLLREVSLRGFAVSVLLPLLDYRRAMSPIGVFSFHDISTNSNNAATTELETTLAKRSVTSCH